MFPETTGVTQLKFLTPCSYVPRIKGTNDRTAGALFFPTTLNLDPCALINPSVCLGLQVRDAGTLTAPRLL